MEEKMKKLIDYFQYYAYITFGTVIVCAINFTLFHEGDLPEITLWQILFSSFLTTTATVILLPKDCERKSRLIIRLILHYLRLLGIMWGCGLMFGWMRLTPDSAGMMLLSVAGVYFIAFLLHYGAGKKLAAELNEILQKRNGGNDEIKDSERK